MSEKKYNFYFDYNEKEFCFYLEKKQMTFKELYTKYEKEKKYSNLTEDKFEIELDNEIYFFQSPRIIKFFFPDKTNKDVFISNPRQAHFILTKFTKHDFFYTKGDEETFQKFQSKELKNIYPLTKIKILEKDISPIIESNNREVLEYEKLIPKDLAYSYDKYLEHSNNIDNNQFFNLTEYRKKLFNILDEELIKNFLIPIAGPEGIGKTTSILAYCKIKIKFDYFYFNAKTFYKLLSEKNISEIEDLLIEELSRSMNNQIKIKQSVKKICEKLDTNNSLFFLIEILKELVGINLLIIDQYKTSLDDNYFFLQKLINQFKSSINNIIVLSSMNEDDVKNCIIKGIKNESKNNNFYLDYLYIGELAEVSKDMVNSLNPEEKEILSLFGNLYSNYYKLLEFKKKEAIFDRERFQEVITKEIKSNLKIYYKSKQEYEIYFMLEKLIKLSFGPFNKEKFIDNYDILPFRFIKFSINNKTIFKINEVYQEENYKFEYLYKIMYKILFNIQTEIYRKIERQKNLLENIKQAIKPLNLENSFYYYLLGQKSFDKINIQKILQINSIYKPSEEDFKRITNNIENLKINEGILISQKNINALSFDFGIIVKNEQNNYKLYLIQVTRKKDAHERLTITSLNDYFGYLKGLYKIKCNILIDNDFFCYIFEEESKDYYTINYCKENKLDYLTFSPKNFLINNNKEYKLGEYLMKKKILNDKINYIEKDIKIEKYFPEYNNIKKTRQFLKRKRALMKDKSWEKIPEILIEIQKKDEYYKAVEKNFISFKKNVNYDYNEEEINKYLLNKEFKEDNLIGIKYLIPKQSELLNQLKSKGLSDKEIENLYNLINIDKKNFLILNIKLYDIFIPYYVIPEYMTFIVLVPKNDKEKYYLDYTKKKKIVLRTKEEKDFEDFSLDKSLYIAITFISKNMAKENSINNINLEELKFRGVLKSVKDHKMDLKEEIEDNEKKNDNIFKYYIVPVNSFKKLFDVKRIQDNNSLNSS